MLYCATNESLAMLELRVHAPHPYPRTRLRFIIEVPDDAVYEPTISQLPRGWNKLPPSPASKHFGDEWVAKGSSLGLLVPSVIASDERNLLLNPAHPRFKEVRLVRKSRVRLDMRLYGGGTSMTGVTSLPADHFLLGQGHWSASGKSIPRQLASVAPEFASRFDEAFNILFASGRTEGVIGLCAAVLAPCGGWLFDGYKAIAPRGLATPGGCRAVLYSSLPSGVISLVLIGKTDTVVPASTEKYRDRSGSEKCAEEQYQRHEPE